VKPRRAFRLHLWTFVVVNIALNAANWFVGANWWAFWPLVVWGLALAVHYLIFKSKRVDERWVEERTEEVHSKAYDAAHIDSIEKRYSDTEKK
jgi:hypothetical protein